MNLLRSLSDLKNSERIQPKNIKKNGFDIALISFVAVLFLTGCEKEKPEPTDLSTKITISNDAASQISYHSATLNATLGDTYGQTVQDYGHCWSTNQEPKVSNYKSSFGQTIGGKSFTSNIEDLLPGTMYHTRAYFKINNIVVYSNDKAFTSLQLPAGITVTDFDGNIYQTVQIGEQLWMAEDIRTTRYADGSAIQHVESSVEWEALTSTDKAYCWYDNSTTNRDTYGGLYTWAAAMNGASSSDANPSGVQGVCPDGWHLPSDSEWKELEMYLGMSQLGADSIGSRGTDEGGKLKEAGELHWFSPNTGATNESGFTALPGGIRNSEGLFYFLGSSAKLLSATEYDSTRYRYRSLYYENSRIYRTISSKKVGTPVRCVKD